MDIMRESKLVFAAKAAASVVLAGCLVASLGFNIYQFNRADVQDKKVNKFIDNQLELQAKEKEKDITWTDF